MKKKLFVIVDMINGFVNFGALHDPYINHITEGIKDVALTYLECGYDVVAFQDAHEMGDEEFLEYPIHCLKGSSESELVPELQPLAPDMYCILKNTTNGFMTKEFQKFYCNHYQEYESVVVVGCCTDICVSDFTVSLATFHHENGIDTPIIVPKDLVETFDAPGHLRRFCSDMGFMRMAEAGAVVVDHYRDIFHEKKFIYDMGKNRS